MSRNRAWKRMVGMVAVLSVFGLIYNGFVACWKRSGKAAGYDSVLVIAGTLVTLLVSVALNGWDATVRTLACFAASGAPMAVGSIWRHCKRREGAERRAEHLAFVLEGRYHAQEIEAEGRRNQV